MAECYEFQPYTIAMKSCLKSLGCFVALAVIVVSHSPAQDPETPSRMLTSAQAETLVIASLSKQAKRLPGIQAEQFKGYSPQFLFFTVLWNPPANWTGSVVVGNYAVDPRTADVWSATASCLKETNHRLRILQKQFREQLGLSNWEYKRLKSSGPLCSN
jgi:hypothetical protein